MAKVVLASSLFLLREGMKEVLSTHRDIHVTGVFSCAKDLCARTKFDEEEIIVFADPIFDLTAKALDDLSSRFSSIKLIMIAPIKTMRARLEELGQGMRGILAAESSVSCFADAVRAVHSGRAYVSVELLDLFSRHVRMKSASSIHECLSERELEVFRGIAVGKRNCTIGSELDISSKTVSTHKIRLMDKLGVSSVPELVQYALQNGLIDIAFQRGSK